MQIADINLRDFIRYKFLNALFTGVSVGSIFTIYAPLPPDLFSVGGIMLALSMLLVARGYVRLLNRTWFWRISLGVELVMLLLVTAFLLFSYRYATALFVYAGYQLTFAFGAYLVRAETILIRRAKALTYLDVSKQSGYLAGMVVAFVFYEALKFVAEITDNQTRVYLLHYLLVLDETAVIYFLYRAFHSKRRKSIK